MTPIADMIEEMLARGAPIEAILIAVRSLEMSGTLSGTIVGQVREYERLRKREYRSKNKAKPEANDAGSNTSSVPDNVPDKRHESTSLLSVFIPKKSIQEVSKKEVNTRARGTRLPQDWQPTPDLVQYAKDHGVDPTKFRDEFVDFWTGVPGSRGLKINWPGTWRNRVRAVTGQTGAPNGHRGPRPLQDDSRSASRTAARLADQARRGEFEFSPRPGLLPR